MNGDYVKPDWCNESTWENAKNLVFTLVPESLMSRTGQQRIELAAKALIKEAAEAWEQVEWRLRWTWKVIQTTEAWKANSAT